MGTLTVLLLLVTVGPVLLIAGIALWAVSPVLFLVLLVFAVLGIAQAVA